MVYINEFFPNPVGPDAQGEFVELYNDGSGTVSLAGWKLSAGTRTATGIIPNKTKPFSLAGYSVGPRGYLVLKKEQTKLSLKNTDGGLLLYGPDGTIADGAGFTGGAPEGKSFSRMDRTASSSAQQFAFADPTPGGPNKAFESMIEAIRYPIGEVLDPGMTTVSLLSLALGGAATVTLSVLYIIYRNENISHYLFGVLGGNETPR